MIKTPLQKLEMIKGLDCYVKFFGATVGGRSEIPLNEYFEKELKDIETALKRYERLGNHKFFRKKKLDQLERNKKLDEFNKRAIDIIHTKGLDFAEFMISTSGYEYNVCRSRLYKKLSAKEYLILKCIIKHEYGLLEVL